MYQAAKEVAETMLKGEAPDDKERLVVTATVAAFLEEGEEEVDVTPQIFLKNGEHPTKRCCTRKKKKKKKKKSFFSARLCTSRR